MFRDDLSWMILLLFCVFVVDFCLRNILCFVGGVVVVTISVYIRFG